MNVFVLFCCTVLTCGCILLYVLCCLMFIDMFHIQMQLMQRLDHWNEYVCMYGMEEKNYIFKTCLMDEKFLYT